MVRGRLHLRPVSSTLQTRKFSGLSYVGNFCMRLVPHVCYLCVLAPSSLHLCARPPPFRYRSSAVARTTQERRVERQKAMESGELKARAKPTTVTSASAVPAQYADSAMQMVKLSLVVDQADDREVRPLEQNQVDSAYPVHKMRMGDYPRQEEDDTPTQPRQRSWQRSGRCFRGSTGVRSTQTMILGPGFGCRRRTHEWQACWAVVKTGAIRPEELSPSMLDRWEKMVTNYTGRHEAEGWVLIYQGRGRSWKRSTLQPRLAVGRLSVRRRTTPSSDVRSLRNQHCSSRCRLLA